MSSLSKLNKEKSQKYKAQTQSNRWHDEFCKMRKQRDEWRAKYNQLAIVHTDSVRQIKHLCRRLQECRKNESVLDKIKRWISER